jgi:transcriptional regulator with XRE-family HTH domain
VVTRVLNKKLKITLIEKDLTQRELAVLTGIAEPTLSGITRGFYIPSPEQIQKIANVLKCDAAAIFG